MLELDGVALGYGSRKVIEGVHLQVAAGERVGLVGPSGAGKSSLLKVMAGLLGVMEGKVVNRFERRRLVFQEPRLLPWRSVADNIDLALAAAGVVPAERAVRRTQWLEKVGLQGMENAWPGELSGGMAQRVALARALAVEPDLLLLDEPFSALDPELRRELGLMCSEQAKASHAALVCISHQPWELAQLVDRIYCVANGHIHELDKTGGVCDVPLA